MQPATATTGASVRTIVLPGGRLDVAVFDAILPLDRLCGFAARDNARRGCLVVSRVLGRHLPVAPREMQVAVDALAARLPEALPGPVLFVGMAETAICLGQSVHAAWARSSGRADSLFLHSTRQQIDGEVVATFDEPHSHASAHLIYAPADPDLRARMAVARSLVLVDDEISTGTTLANLAQALAPRLPSLEAVVTAVLADWSDAAYLAAMPVAARGARLLRGRLDWRGDGATRPASAAAAPPAALGRMAVHHNFGRLGSERDPAGIDALAARLGGRAPERLLVLGTGEFTYPPFLLARALERAGHDVVMQATTRSPVHVGGVIERALTFADNYGTAVPNYLYNVPAGAGGRRVLICHETPPGSIDPALVAALDAECVAFGAGA